MKERGVSPTEEFDRITNRAGMVGDLFSRLGEVNSDFERVPLTELTYQLLMSDPMSIQEAGVVARALRDVHRENEGLTEEEWLELYSGDYDSAEEIFGRNKHRKAVWNRSFLERDDNDEEVYLFREMNIDDKEAVKIKREGLKAKGIYDYGNVEKVIDRLIRKKSMGRLPISKFNLFRDVWWMDLDYGYSNPLKLGLSLTTFDNLHNQARIVFGNQMIVARMPSNRAVRERDKYFDKQEDERTILFELPPENVVAVVDTKGDRGVALKMAQNLVKVDRLKRKLSFYR